MMEVFRESLYLVNLPLTALLIFIVIYWAAVILGFLDFDAFDIDVDVDADYGGLLHSAGMFFHLDESPFVAVFSVLVLCMWTISMIANHFMNPSGSLWMGAALCVPNFFVSVLITRLITLPLHRLFKALNRSEEGVARELVGMPCRVTTSNVTLNSGQAEVEAKGSPILISARTASSDETLHKGDEAVIVHHDLEKNIYTIKKLEE